MALTLTATDWWNTIEGHNGFTEIGNIADTDTNGALRFQNLTLSQGQSIQQALLKFYVQNKGSGSGDLQARIWGIDEDNTGSFSSSPMGRAKTTAVNTDSWSLPPTGEYSNHDVTSIVQEILNRSGWNSGNAIGFILENNGSPTNVYVDDYNTGNHSQLEITISSTSPSASASASVSPSASASLSRSPSASLSPSASRSPSASVSASGSPTPAPSETALMKIAKAGVNVLTNTDPSNLKFSSEYGTLKYYTKQQVIVSFDANAGEISGNGRFDHNLGYYPFCEVFVRSYIGAPSGNYEYVPFFGSGATVAYGANVKITKNSIFVYAEINGVSTSVWNFDFLIFVYKNRLNL